MITRQETVTATSVSGGVVANFWIEWAQPALEAALLIVSLIAIVLLVYHRLLDIRLKRMELRDAVKAHDEA